ncbi:DUF2256 domain-containing protein [Pantoea sp. S61]|uniref:DUF2256 domain-containing protein n=1 Tax=Pantoea sp. S61 TaxID=2767442 RepID=UPI00190B6F13|nr:DUF2256 domain-containing protein [Pantoea sp. S61]MBK0127757.1 DUF2256 domain-containing protein [Pantoea sp. S61]
MENPLTTKTFKVNKQNLPVRYCKQCHKPMTWRKKWEKCWEEVQFCSERCRRAARSHTDSSE